MPPELWKQLGLKDLCRCCHSHAQTSYKSLYKPFIWLQTERIVLADLLMECFNIELVPVNKPLSHIVCTICNTCIKRLQEAVIFKRQVQKCEERFKELYSEFLGKVSSIKVIIKEEIIEDKGNNNEEVCEDTPNTAVEQENASMEADVQNIEKANNESTTNKQEKITDDDDDDGLTDPWDDIDFDSIDKGNIRKAKKEDASVETPATHNRVIEKSSKDYVNGEDYERVGDQYQCCKCKKTYSSYGSLSGHIKSTHSPSYTCPHCSQTFFVEAAFVKHKLNEHNIDDRVNCMACDKTFCGKARFTEHLNRFHMLGVKRKCDLCDFETHSSSALYGHKRVHKTVKNYHCPYCKKSFVRSSTLSYHVKIHTGDKRKVCNECGKAFVQKASLNYHMAKYHPEVPF